MRKSIHASSTMEQKIVDKIIKEWTINQSFDEKVIRLFERVRDIPYGNINSRNPLDVYQKNKGTCSGKHELLKVLYRGMGISVKDFLILHRFRDMKIKWPEKIEAILETEDFIDPHNFLKIEIKGKWITVDATWDKPLEKLGFYVNQNWEGKNDMKLVVQEGGSVQETDNPFDLKEKLISQMPESAQKNRKQFLSELSSWLEEWRNSL